MIKNSGTVYTMVDRYNQRIYDLLRELDYDEWGNL